MDNEDVVFLDNFRYLADSQSSSANRGSSGSVCVVDSHHHGHVHSHEAVLFPFVAVLIGCFLTHLPPRFMFFRILPYTVWLFVTGILLGILDIESNHKLGNLSESISMWINIDPHVLLYTFLPVLLFGDSMNIKYYDFKSVAMQCTILAGPGVLAGTGMMYIVSKHIFPYKWTTNEAAAFAAILSATDPVAVVALLNEMGASQILTMQIAGESLLNDGMAIVVWTLFFDLMMGQEYEFIEIIGKFCQLAGGGVAFGIFIGIIALRGLSLASDKLIHSDHMVQMALTFAAAYLSFFIGENELKVSGVLSTIFAALTIGRSAWPVMCSPETVKAVWHTAEFFGNTILFALCGLVFYQSTKTVESVDWLWLLLLYALGVVARVLLLIVAYPFLNLAATTKATQVTWKETIVMAWGGLRGAVGLAMALSMRSQLRLCGKQETGDRMVFFVGGFAGLTLLINASTCGMLLEMLGLTKPPEAREKLLSTLQQELLMIAREECRNLTLQDRRFAACSFKEVDKILVRQNEYGHQKIAESTQPASKKGIGILVTQVQEVVNSAKMNKSNTTPKLPAAVAALKLATPHKKAAVQAQNNAMSGSILMLAQPTGQELQPVTVSAQTNEGDQRDGSIVSPASCEGQFQFQVLGKSAIAEEGVERMSTPSHTPSRKNSELEDITQAKTIKKTSGTPVVAVDHWWWGFDPIQGQTLDPEASKALEEISDETLEGERKFYLTMLRAQYERQLREDLIPMNSEGAIDLPASIDRSSDITHDGLKDWAMLQKEMLYEPHSCMRHFLKIAGASPYSPYAPVYTKQEKKFDLFSVVVFLDSHHLVCARLSTERSLNCTSRRAVVDEAAREVEEAHMFLKDNNVGPEKIGIVRTKQLLAVLYARQRKQVYKWKERGIINDAEAEELIHPVHHSMKEVKDMCLLGDEIGVKVRDCAVSPNSKDSGYCSGIYATLFGSGSGHKVLDTE